MKNKTARAAFGQVSSSYKPSSYIGDANQTVSALDYSVKYQTKQLLSSGAVEKLTDDLTAHLTKPRRVVKCVRCAGCGIPHAPSKMSALYPICRACLIETREKGVKAQSNFINRAVNNFQIFLKGALTV